MTLHSRILPLPVNYSSKEQKSQASAYLNNGYIAGTGKVLNDGSIMVDSLTMNKVGWENNVDFDSLFGAITSDKSLQVKK